MQQEHAMGDLLLSEAEEIQQAFVVLLALGMIPLMGENGKTMASWWV